MAFAIKYRDTSQVAVCYFGEAAVNNGAFHEALNMAALWKLPAVYICENNRYGMGTALERASAIYDISERASSYDMANEVVDGQDVLVMHAAMERAVQRARTAKHPTLLEVRTYRFMGHSMSDPIHGHYRTREEVEDQRKRDPIAVWSQRLIGEGMLDEAAVKAMDEEVDGRGGGRVPVRRPGARPGAGSAVEGRVRGHGRSQQRSRWALLACQPSPTATPSIRRSAKRCSATPTSSSWARKSASTRARTR